MRGSVLRGARGAGALCLLSLQLVAGVALPSADAVLEAERVGLPLHIESPHNADCPAAHDHLFCQVVRSLGSASASQGVGTVPRVAPAVLPTLRAAQRQDIDQRPSLRGPAAPRPPPLG